MADWRERWQHVLSELEQERDELRVRLHLARAETRDEWNRLDQKIEALRLRARAAGSEAKDAARDVGEAAEQLVAEIRQGLERVRRTL